MTHKKSPDPVNMRDQQRGYLLLIVMPFLASSNMLVARASVEFIPPVALSFWRWAVTLVLLGMLTGPRLWAGRRDVLAEWKDLLLLGALGMGVCGAFVYIGAASTSATNIGLIYTAAPVLIILLGRFFYDEKLNFRQSIGVFICLAGVLAIIAKGNLSNLLFWEFNRGDLWIAAATLGWAVYSIMQKHRPSKLGLMRRLTATTAAGVLILAPFTVWENDSASSLVWDGKTILTILFLALVPSLGAYAVYARIQIIFGAARAGLVMYLIPLVNSFLAWALLDEQFEFYHYLGAALVLPGLWLATRKNQ